MTINATAKTLSALAILAFATASAACTATTAPAASSDYDQTSDAGALEAKLRSLHATGKLKKKGFLSNKETDVSFALTPDGFQDPERGPRDLMELSSSAHDYADCKGYAIVIPNEDEFGSKIQSSVEAYTAGNNGTANCPYHAQLYLGSLESNDVYAEFVVYPTNDFDKKEIYVGTLKLGEGSTR